MMVARCESIHGDWNNSCKTNRRGKTFSGWVGMRNRRRTEGWRCVTRLTKSHSPVSKYQTCALQSILFLSDSSHRLWQIAAFYWRSVQPQTQPVYRMAVFAKSVKACIVLVAWLNGDIQYYTHRNIITRMGFPIQVNVPWSSYSCL